ncbi:Rab family GTPase [Agaribacter flavus]|uniref:Rab family GTPase n=1 Tax=Agaribacter flavus TaxID=1902781 RepID=A0ABV7FTX2_9ALTE
MLQKKICILGSSGVGKTSLIKQFIEGIFSEKYLTSIGVKVDKKIVNAGFSPVQLLLWDIEGVDRYSGFNPRYLRGCSGLIIVADISRFNTLSEAIELYNSTQEHTDSPVVLAVNKEDLNASINWNEAILTENQHCFAKIFKTSAKTGNGVQAMFEFIGKLVSQG